MHIHVHVVFIGYTADVFNRITSAPKKCCMKEGAKLGFSHLRMNESMELAAAKFTSTRNRSRVETYDRRINNCM